MTDDLLADLERRTDQAAAQLTRLASFYAQLAADIKTARGAA